MTPGQADLAAGELDRAEGAQREGRILLEAMELSGAANRLYYAVFHAARAALTIRGLHSKTHAGLIALFGETFGPEPLLDRLLRLRGRADYSMEEFTTTEGELAALADDAARFVDRCRTIVSEVAARGPNETDPPADA